MILITFGRFKRLPQRAVTEGLVGKPRSLGDER
jgi:hypothetical protein